MEVCVSYEMEAEDFMHLRDAELAAEREENARLRIRCEAAERGQELAIANGLKFQRLYFEARRQLQSWADEADKDNALARAIAAEREALEL